MADAVHGWSKHQAQAGQPHHPAAAGFFIMKLNYRQLHRIKVMTLRQRLPPFPPHCPDGLGSNTNTSPKQVSPRSLWAATRHDGGL